MTNKMRVWCLLVAVLAVSGSDVWAAKAKKEEPVVLAPLTEQGQKLEAKYSGQIKILQAQIADALPKTDEARSAKFLEAYRSEAGARAAELKAVRGANKKAEGSPEQQALQKAKSELALAATNSAAPVAAILEDLKDFLASEKLDEVLVKCVVMMEATPRGLAEYAEQGDEQLKLLEKMLSDTGLMRQMLIGGGAVEGKYGQAMKIYEDIQKASDKSKEGVLQKLALAVALEHAVPITQTNPAAQADGPATVDPVKRYLSYEKAYLDGHLDEGFKDLSVWDYRMVVDGDEPDETAAWGRAMLRNYRPDEVTTPDYRWRYVQAVKTEVRYGSDYNKFDRPDLQNYQNMIMNGGVCGRRAFFGRFILRAFGVPTTARPQPGHAALVHWTPDGWVVCLGAGWTWGTTKTKFKEDRDFLAHTQARMAGPGFEQALRAQWIGTALGETWTGGFHDAASGFWNGVSLYKQRELVEAAQAKALAAVGEDIGEANESKEKDIIEEVTLTDEDKLIVVGTDGAITVPATACTFSTNSPGKILFMESNLGGKQMHYNRNGAQLEFEYTFDAPKAGKYEITARVVTVSPDQVLLVSVNGASAQAEMLLPFTVGMWGSSEPVQIDLAEGKNVLKLSRGGDNIRGVSIRDFILSPVK